MKTTLYLNQKFPFASAPVCSELEPSKILCNDVSLPGGFNPHNVRLWVIGNEYGAMGAVWAGNEGDAIDELIDAGLAGGILIEEADATEETARGGNAGEAYDSEHLWMAEVVFEPVRDLSILLKFAEAKGNCADTLDF